MKSFRQLVGEAHWRSLWQVFGLPDCVPGFAVVLLLIGLPSALWANADPELQPRVRAKREMLQHLQRD